MNGRLSSNIPGVELLNQPHVALEKVCTVARSPVNGHRSWPRRDPLLLALDLDLPGGHLPIA